LVRRTSQAEYGVASVKKDRFERLAGVGQTVAAIARWGRKVRAPQGKALDNVQRGQPQGKCHREQSARYGG